MRRDGGAGNPSSRPRLAFFPPETSSGWDMKVAGYLHPGIFPQGPIWDGGWIDIVGRMLQVLHRDAASECLLISGARFVRSARELLDGIRLAEIDEIALLRRINRDGGAATALDRLAYRGPPDHPALRVLAAEIVRASGA